MQRAYAAIKNIAVGHVPRGFSLSPDGARLFVTNSWDDTLSVIDTQTLEVTATWPVGAEPSSVVEDRAGKHLFVANRISNDVAVLDAQTGAEEKRLVAGRGASYMTPSPDGSRLYVTHVYPNSPRVRSMDNRTPPESEITVIDAARAVVVDRIPLHSIAGVLSCGVLRRWAAGRGGGISSQEPGSAGAPGARRRIRRYADAVWRGCGQAGRGAAGRTGALCVAALWRGHCAGQVAHLRDQRRLGDGDCDRCAAPAALHPHASSGRMRRIYRQARIMWSARIAVGHDPRGLALTRDGRRLFVANRLDDTISVIDTRTNRVASTITLDGPKEISALRHGEQTFYTSRYSFQGQIGCANCHIDSTFDGLTWDLEPDGFGRDIVDNRLLEDIKGTEPYKWNGGNPNMPTECGPRTEKYFWRSENYDDLTLADLATYIRSLAAAAQSLAAGRAAN